ncbi:hypothetical protein R1sor_000333 [Riccia sorocarpa]|uniref:C2H2-type domain-containing protein n=1 Tax=Riccia sorocarpa TaxID=122646 RepID=A0ABD3GUH3_9MARC
MGVRTPKSELARKVMGEYTFRTHEGQSFATCRYCGLEYVYNITRLTTHFTGDHEPRGGALQPRKGSVKHVKVCGSVPYAVKEAIRSLHRNKTSKQREIREDSERQSASAMPDEEDRDIQRETLAHPMFREAYNFSSKLPGYKFPSSTALRTTLLDKNFNDVKKTAEQNMWGHNFCVRGYRVLHRVLRRMDESERPPTG